MRGVWHRDVSHNLGERHEPQPAHDQGSYGKDNLSGYGTAIHNKTALPERDQT